MRTAPQQSVRLKTLLRFGLTSPERASLYSSLGPTPNFLNNKGWTRREYDSIFTRELVEKQKVILPVWNQISAEDVYQHSPILADRVAAQWSLGKEEVARRLLNAIDAPAE